jgi:hypothetical protein
MDAPVQEDPHSTSENRERRLRSVNARVVPGPKTRQAVYEEAKQRDVPGRSKMGPAELAKAMCDLASQLGADPARSCSRLHAILPREPRDGAAEGASVGSGDEAHAAPEGVVPNDLSESASGRVHPRRVTHGLRVRTGD